MVKGSKHSLDARRRMGEALKGVIPWNKGKPSPLKGKKGLYRHSKEVRIRMSLAHKGNHYPKISAAKKGVLPSEAIKQKMRLSHKPENHWAWKGGVSQNLEWVSWRKNKRNRLKRALNLNGSSHAFGEWQTLKAQYNWTCPACHKQEPEIKLTEDHIIPLSKGGGDNIENIQPLCMSCNCKKNDKTIYY